MHVFIPLFPTPPSFPNEKTLAKTISFSEPTKPETGGCQTDWINKKPSTTLLQCCVMISLTSMPGNMNLGTGNSHPHASQSARVGRRHMAYIYGVCTWSWRWRRNRQRKNQLGKEMAITKKTTNVENWQRTKIWETFWQTYWILKLSHSHYPAMTLRFIAQFKWGFMTDFSTFFFRYLTININGRLWQELGVQHWEIPMEPLTNMAMNNPKRKYWHCGM